MLSWLSRRSDAKRSAHELYGSSVAQARAEPFYTDLGVADTISGRFELLVLHVFLVMERLAREGEAGRELAQLVSEVMFSELDAAMREMGVSDLRVPRGMHQAAGAWLGRVKAYGEACAAGDEARLADAIARNVLEEAPESSRHALALARYALRVREVLARQDYAALSRGVVRFPAVIEEAG